MKLEVIISLIIGALGVIVAALALIKNHKSGKKNLELQKKNIELQEKLLAREKEKERQQILDQTVKDHNEKHLKKSHAQLYCEHITGKFRYLDFTGLNAILQKPLLLEDIYVKLRAKPAFQLDHYRSIADFQQLEKEKGTKKEDEDKENKEPDRDFVTVFRELRQERQEKKEPLKAVILGHPGSGKTTLMKWIALQCACADETSAFAGLIPVLIPLKDLGREPDLFLKKSIRQLTKERFNEKDIPDSFLDDSFENNRLLFLLDGLDEVAEEDVRRKVIAWIQELHIRKNGVLITSRFSGLQPVKGLKFHDSIPVFHILDFEMEDIECFLENWYRNIEVAVAGNAGEEEKAKAIRQGKNRYDDLISTIKSGSYNNLKKLAVNPLLLTIIAIVHRTRAVLPKERNKLYEECLKVMIELWNVANRKIDVSFSVENSIANLAKLAVELMKEDRRELELKEIEVLLPEKIENHPLKFFLKEMVLKAGLLYSSEGGYGFLHLTFQEYLAAWHFARSGNQIDILRYRDKDYWSETFKLFVNIANAQHFYNEIIENLEEKEYWKHMQLWDDCLKEVVLEGSQREIELTFVSKIFHIIPNLNNKVENEMLIDQLFGHYSLYKHHNRFVENGWELLNQANHPFVRSVGSYFLDIHGKVDLFELRELLMMRIAKFEEIKDKGPDNLLDFLHQNLIMFAFISEQRGKIIDYYNSLKLFSSADNFIVYLSILLYCYPIRIVHQEKSPTVSFLNWRSFMDMIEKLDLRKFLQDHMYRSMFYKIDLFVSVGRALLVFPRGYQSLSHLRELRDIFLKEHKKLIKRKKAIIDHWLHNTLEELNTMSDDKLLEYFPNTTKEEIKQFRENVVKNEVKKSGRAEGKKKLQLTTTKCNGKKSDFSREDAYSDSEL